MRSSTLLALFVCVVFVSSGFRTAFGQYVIQMEEGEEYEAFESDEWSDEDSSEAGYREMSGELQVDSDELEVSAAAGDGDADEQDLDVDIVPNEPDTNQFPDPSRSDNLDTCGKRSLYTVGVKTVYVAVVVVSVVTCEECDWVDGTKNLGNFSRQRK